MICYPTPAWTLQLSGCALLFIGIYTLVTKENKILFTLFAVDGRDAFLQYLSYALIGVGALVFLVGFCGCCGAMQESKCMLVTYFLFLLIILVAELAVGVMAVLFQDQTLQKFENRMTKTIRDEYGRNEGLTQSVDFAQTKFTCCGVHGPQDYEGSRWRRDDMGRGDNIVKTCCVLSNRNQTDAYLEPKPVDNARCQSNSPSDNREFRHQKVTTTL
ncbi:hypothetical protein LAZ67_2001727 [Cordylochernes scorpioides]|uniref:Tetraspanin n=1 Tax=Cordylochernes scorpioides TaxID=51811 RepID=A0ABY6K369_9ARAC|nr:hypothetical protein LAZ67_2001727 [Cordylochernes scorpioides]